MHLDSRILGTRPGLEGEIRVDGVHTGNQPQAVAIATAASHCPPLQKIQ